MNEDQYGSLTDEEVLVYNLACAVAAEQHDHLSALEAFDAFMDEFFLDNEA